MRNQLNELKKIIGEINDLQSTISLLDWDQQTYMPQQGAEERACQIETLSRIAHEKSTSARMGRMLDRLQKELSGLDPDSDDARLIAVATREFRRKTRVPVRLAAEFARVTSTAQHAWKESYGASDFSIFQPHLEKIFELRREYAECFAPYEHIYDPLLDEFEPGLKTSEVLAVFDRIRPRQAALIRELENKPPIDNAFMFQKFDPVKQWEFGVFIATAMGYDWQRGRIDKTLHPFTTRFGLGDVRITTRIIPENLTSGLFGTIHEAGHALYEQGVARNLTRTPLGAGASLALHESQSRLWENIVGRSREFWQWAYPYLRQTFPEQLTGTSAEQFHLAINRVKPSCIRIEADEVTYNMHIMLRLELEIAVLEGRINVRELPELWREKMSEYIGVVPTSDREGVLQDVHWSCGIIGYFPTYALGNMIAAQIWEQATAEIEGIGGLIANGEFTPLREWLTGKLYRYGSKFEPADLIMRVTGSPLDPEPYLNYLHGKYRDIYS